METNKRVKFTSDEPTTVERKQLTTTSHIEIYKNVLADYHGDLNDLVNSMWDEERPVYQFFGRDAVSDRTQRFYATSEKIRYDFPGAPAKTITDFHPFVQRCRDFVQKKHPELDYNAVLVNLYKTAKDSIGMHADDETIMVPGAPIYSFSFGCVRTFVIQPKTKNNQERKDGTLKLQMLDNSLIVMCGNMQEQFKHGVPPMPKKIAQRLPENCWRVNVTVRAFIEPKVHT